MVPGSTGSVSLLPKGVLNIVNGFGLEAASCSPPASGSPKSPSPGRRTTGRLIMQYASTESYSGGDARTRRQIGPTSSSRMSKLRTTISSTRRSRASSCSRSTRARSAPARAARLLDELLYDRFMERRPEARLRDQRKGSPLDPNTMAPASATEQLEKILSYVDKIGKQEGAKVLIGGERNMAAGRSRGRLLHEANRVPGEQSDARYSRRKSSDPWFRSLPSRTTTTPC